MIEIMSKCIKSATEWVKYNICCLEEECDALHYEVYICYREHNSLVCNLTLTKFDNQYDQLQRLENMYKIELS